MKSIVLNFFGEPCARKSTAAAYVFSKLKMMGIDCELVTEFAKDKVWENNKTAITYQPYILGCQMYRIHRVNGKVQVIIVDSPIPLGLLYNDCGSKFYKDFAMEEFNKYNNVNYVLETDGIYTDNGRVNTKEESKQIKAEMLDLLDKYKVKYKTITSTTENYDKICLEIRDKVLEEK